MEAHMSDVKKVREHLKALTRPQLVALAVQRFDTKLSVALTYTNVELIANLEMVEGVLAPVQA
jgi:hypothetical protein